MKAKSIARLSKAGNTAKKLGSSALNIGLPIGFGIMEYNASRQEGNGKIISAGRAVGEYVMGETLGFSAYVGIAAVSAIPRMAVGVGESIYSMSRSMNRSATAGPFQNAVFNDSQQAYTMRQAGMQMAQASKYNLQQTLMGNEAQYMKL